MAFHMLSSIAPTPNGSVCVPRALMPLTRRNVHRKIHAPLPIGPLRTGVASNTTAKAATTRSPGSTTNTNGAGRSEGTSGAPERRASWITAAATNSTSAMSASTAKWLSAFPAT